MKIRLTKRPPTAVMLVAMTLAAGVAYADVKHLTATLTATTPTTLVGAEVSWNLFLPQFDSALGNLYGITFSNSNDFIVGALMTAQGGIFLPPDYIDGWNFASLSYFRLKGPGVDYTTTGPLSDSGGGNYSFEHAASVLKSGHADSKIPSISAPSNAASSYIGSGTVLMTFTAGVTTAIGMPATPGGFTTIFSTILTAGIAQQSTSTINVDYYYTAAAVPEPGSWALLLGGLGVTGFVARRRSRKE